MKTEPSYPAFPKDSSPYYGLSIRAYLAARNMAAMLSNPYGGNMPDGTKSFHPEDIAELAVIYADSLINELNKEQ